MCKIPVYWMLYDRRVCAWAKSSRWLWAVKWQQGSPTSQLDDGYFIFFCRRKLSIHVVDQCINYFGSHIDVRPTTWGDSNKINNYFNIKSNRSKKITHPFGLLISWSFRIQNQQDKEIFKLPSNFLYQTWVRIQIKQWIVYIVFYVINDVI